MTLGIDVDAPASAEDLSEASKMFALDITVGDSLGRELSSGGSSLTLTGPTPDGSTVGVGSTLADVTLNGIAVVDGASTDEMNTGSACKDDGTAALLFVDMLELVSTRTS